ncbi:MAG: ABC transporter permease [Aigarchaeota archaeon]|nr:ABC transporter permease [Candidatus Calditenuaceae archaeon]
MFRRSLLSALRLPVKVERRPEVTPRFSIAVTLGMLLLAFLASGAIFQLLGFSALHIYRSFFTTLLSPIMLEEVFRRSAPIILSAIGLCYSYRMGFWNIGAEGQLYMGMIAATGVVVLYSAGVGPGDALLLPTVVAASMLAGGAWSLIPAALKTKFRANEIITTLMLNYTAILLADYLVHGAWKDPAGYGFAQTVQFPAGARISLPGFPDAVAYLALTGAVTVLTFIVFRYTVFGFESRIVGLNIFASRYAGLRINSIILRGVLISGALAGLAGLIVVSGLIGRLRPGASPGYGYHAIIASLLGGLYPPAVFFSSILFGMLLTSGDLLQASIQMPKSGVEIIMAMIFLATIVAEFVKRHRLRLAGGVRGGGAT